MYTLITNFSVCIIFRANTSASLLHVWIGGAKLQQILCSSAVEKMEDDSTVSLDQRARGRARQPQPIPSGDAYWHLFQQSANVTQGETKKSSNKSFKAPRIINEITQQIVVCKIFSCIFRFQDPLSGPSHCMHQSPSS